MEMKYNTIFMYDTYMHMCNYDIRDNVEFFIKQQREISLSIS